MRFYLLALAASCSFAYQSITVTPSASIQVSTPAVPPFTALGDYRIVFRLHGWTAPAAGSVILIRLGGAQFSLDSTNKLCGVDLTDTLTSGNSSCVVLTGLNDVVIRMQRFGAMPVRQNSSYTYPGSIFLEAVDLTSGNTLSTNCSGWAGAAGCPIKLTAAPNVSGTSGFIGTSVGFSLAWLKWIGSTVKPGSPFENEATPADLADWRFEGNTINLGTGSYALSLRITAGTPTYGSSPLKPPACNPVRQIFRAGSAGQLANYAYPLDGSSGLQYLWQQLSGPTQLLWAGQNTSQPNISGSVFGSYVLQLTVTDGSRQTSTCSVKDGFAATDANGIVTTGNSQVDTLLGPQILLGQNPWSWFDDRHVAVEAVQKANRTNPAFYNMNTPYPWDVAAPGLVTVSNNSATVIGLGTHFQSTFCPGGTLANPTPWISIWYPSATIPGGYGRHSTPVTGCASDTQLTMNYVWNTTGSPLLPPGTYQYSLIPGTIPNNWFNATPGPVDFYDNVEALYSLYYRSGIDDYLTEARALADAWWVFRHDSGNCYVAYGDGFCWTAARNQGAQGMFLRALDGRPDMWTGLEQMANYAIAAHHALFNAHGNWTSIGGDPRENGYELMTEADCALFDPNPAPAAACRAGISEFFTKGWIPGQFPDGYWYTLYWGGAQGGPPKYASWTSGTYISLTNGSPNGTCMNGTGTCSWDASMFTTPGRPVVWWFTNYNPGSPTSQPINFLSGDPTVYYPVMVDSTHLILEDINGNPLNYQGTTGNHGYASGGGSTLLAGFEVQPYMYGILGTAFDFAGKAMGCTSPGVPANCDNTIATDAYQFNQNTANFDRLFGYWPLWKGMYYFAGSLNCIPPVSDTNIGCTSSSTTASAIRTLNAETLRGVMTAYAHSQDPNLLAFADTLYTAMWARPGFQAPGAPASDGLYIGDFEDGYGGYVSGTPPASAAPKYFGMGFGIGAGAAWPGYRLGGAHLGLIVNSSFAINLKSVPHATQFNILIRYPTGITKSVSCSSSPCTVGFDQALGSPTVQIQYLSTNGAVLAVQSVSFPISLN